MEEATSNLHLSGAQWLDLSVIGLLLLSAVLALLRGFTREVLSIGVWVGTFMLCALLFPGVSPLLHNHIENDLIADLVAIAIIACVALVILIPLTNFWAGQVSGRAMTAIDSSLGFVFGLARGVVVVGLLYLVVMMVWPNLDQMPKFIQESRSRPYAEAIAIELQKLVPDSMKSDDMKQRVKQQTIEEKIRDEETLLDQFSSPQPAAPVEAVPNYPTQDQQQLEKIIQQQE